ncbi:hypothetical protein E4U42_003964 [Claviceps africana]|uniref:Uncharacterized protein n=1 Tax=Claviceps africana TaxID=83212 RepID=A0A8K0NJB9_9HYPO|nr:hypothetical protein E4U42_003964 [Claviceps africana]
MCILHEYDDAGPAVATCTKRVLGLRGFMPDDFGGSGQQVQADNFLSCEGSLSTYEYDGCKFQDQESRPSK